MTHPVTPPPELVQEWGHDANLSGVPYDDETGHWEYEQYIAARAAQWGADQELEACCALLELSDNNARDFLQSTRRPKSSSLKEQALEDLEILIADLANHGMGFKATNIRRALEALPDD
jgi:hypothetical protein